MTIEEVLKVASRTKEMMDKASRIALNCCDCKEKLDLTVEVLRYAKIKEENLKEKLERSERVREDLLRVMWNISSVCYNKDTNENIATIERWSTQAIKEAEKGE